MTFRRPGVSAYLPEFTYAIQISIINNDEIADKINSAAVQSVFLKYFW